MKKILVVSDNHFQDQPLEDIVRQHYDVDYFVHCGDSEWQPDAALLQKFIAVRGNNDFALLPENEIVNIEGCRVLAVHGHKQGVFNFGEYPNIRGSEKLVSYAHNEYDANVVFYGHTHVPEAHVDRGVFVLNPGSLNFPRSMSMRIPTYAIVTIDDEHVSARFYEATTGEDVSEKILKGN